MLAQLTGKARSAIRISLAPHGVLLIPLRMQQDITHNNYNSIKKKYKYVKLINLLQPQCACCEFNALDSTLLGHTFVTAPG